MILSPDPLLTTVCPYVADLKLEEGQDVESAVSEVLKMKQIFGVDLYEAGLAELVCGYLKEMTKAPGAVRETLKNTCRRKQYESIYGSGFPSGDGNC